MATVNDRYKSYWELGEDERKKQKDSINTQADTDIAEINKNADEANQTIKRNFETQKADTNEAYDIAFKKNEAQVRTNERYLERKAAEMGLTDSGLNRTQITANQLSYGNNDANIRAQRQKAIDTLAATMNASIAQNDAQRAADISNVNRNRNANIASVDSTYSEWARKQAVEDAEKEAETTNQYLKNPNKYNVYYDKNGNVSLVVDKDERKTQFTNLKTLLENENVDLNEAAALIDDFDEQYVLSEVETRMLWTLVGLTEGDMINYYETGNVYMSPQEYNKRNVENMKDGTNYLGKVRNWDYKKDGKMRYYFKITDATTNWGGGVDNNDKVTIYYPDGTVVAENVKISQLPKDIQKDITDRTSGKKMKTYTTKKINGNDYHFYYTADLSNSTF